MTKRYLATIVFVVVVMLALLGCGLLGDEAAQVTAKPTKTMRPLFTSTFTPTPSPPPTETPPPTDSPAPTEMPAPTETPVSEATPTDTPTAEVPPTEAAASDTPPPTEALPTDTPPPTDTPKPRPTDTPAPPTDTPKPQVDFRVVEKRLMSKAENEAQRHMVLIRVVDANGNPLHGLTVWDPDYPTFSTETGTKPEPYHAELLFGDYGVYKLEVKDHKSETAEGVTMHAPAIPKEVLVAAGYCTDVASCNQNELIQHYSWYITFQRTW